MSQRLGRYQLVRPLAQGGMAEVFHARTEGPGGFEKDVALKRILSHLQIAEGAEGFAELFMDEARIAARLMHPNVVQVFDFGEADGSYFLAMELLDGVDLSTVLRASRRAGVPVPLDVAVYCIAEAAAGLHYAHTLTDTDGAPLRLVHRDVSPSNLFLTRHGEVKVLDFGIAKAEGQLHVTNAGTLKGKHAYVPPEQIHGHELTAQADIWSLGLTLYELCCGARYFDRSNQLETLKAILSEEILPPSTKRADVPPELDAIVLRCVARDLSQRYASCTEVRADLQDLLGTAVGRDMIAAYVRYVGDLQSGRPASPPTSSGLAGASPSGRVPVAFPSPPPSGSYTPQPVALGEPESAAQPERGVRGTLDQLSVPDLVQMIEMGKKSAVVDVWPEGSSAGRLELDGGQLRFAQHGALSGDEAFFALCRSRQGAFHLVYQAPTGQTNVTSPTAFLLLEAMRRLDEATKAPADAAADADPFSIEIDDDDAPPFSIPPDVSARRPTTGADTASHLAARALDAGVDVGRPAAPSPFHSDPFLTPSTGTSQAALQSALAATPATTMSVKELLSRAGPLSVPVVVLVLRGVLRAVAASGGDGRVAPCTIVIDPDGGVRLSRELDDDDDARRAAYESPEEAGGLSLDMRSRLFSTATLCFELLTGQSPFLRPSAAASRAAVKSGARPLWIERAGALPVLVSSLLERMWRATPADRPATPAQALAVVEPLALRLEELYPGALVRTLSDPGGTQRALDAELARRDVARAGELTSGSTEERRQAGYLLLRARAACPDDGRAGARLLRLGQEEGWFVSGPPSSTLVSLSDAIAGAPDDEELLTRLRGEALDEGRFLHAAGALVRLSSLRPHDDEVTQALRVVTGDPTAPYGVVELPPAPVEPEPVVAPEPEPEPPPRVLRPSEAFDDDGWSAPASPPPPAFTPPRLAEVQRAVEAIHIAGTDEEQAAEPPSSRRVAALLGILVAVALLAGAFLIWRAPGETRAASGEPLPAAAPASEAAPSTK